MNRVLILGANGFLGRHLFRCLSDAGYEVKTLSRKGNQIDYKADIAEPGAWASIDFEPDIVVNCAAVLPGGNVTDEDYVKKLFLTNCTGVYNLCKWVGNNETVKYILNISSLSVVSKPWPIPLKEDAPTYPSGPHALYSLSKLNQEVILNNFPFSRKVKIAHARLSALFGENMEWNGIMCSLIDKALKEEPIGLLNGTKVSADYIYVKDVCRHLKSLIEKEAEGIINIASGEEVYLLDLAKMILKLNGNNSDKLSNTDSMLDYNRAVVDTSKLKHIDTDFKNTDFLIALKATIKYRQTLLACYE